MKQITLSIAIATFNEEAHIGNCLDSVKGLAGEIVVVDGQSTDKTLSIAKQFKAKIISTTNKAIFHINKQMAIDACTGDWILQLDADEIVSPELKTEILATISNDGQFNGYWLNRRNYFLGRFLRKGGQYPDPTLRLYRRGKGHLPCQSVHEQAVVEGDTGHLTHDLLHYADTTFGRFLQRNDRYSSLLATQLNNPMFWSYFFIKPISTFFSIYIRHRGYVDAFPGFVFAFYSALRFPTAYVKYWEINHDKNRN